MKIKKTRTTEIMDTIAIQCDVCGQQYEYDINSPGIFETQKFLHIDFVAAFDSVFGDGNNVECDICQYCLKSKLGKFLRINE